MQYVLLIGLLKIQKTAEGKSISQSVFDKERLFYCAQFNYQTHYMSFTLFY